MKTSLKEKPAEEEFRISSLNGYGRPEELQDWGEIFWQVRLGIEQAAQRLIPAHRSPTEQPAVLTSPHPAPETASPLQPILWPSPMHPAAFHGLAGQIVRALEPHTESDPAALLLLALSAFGNIAGPSAHFLAEARRHPMRIWPQLVGETAKGRKGSAWSSVRYLLQHVDRHWLEQCNTSGLSSGEGLIWQVRDPILRHRRHYNGEVAQEIRDPGVLDKRLYVMEEEFSAVLKATAREGNILSDVLRRAWDHGDLATLTKHSPARATGAHITLTGHITKAELEQLLSGSDALNGFGNRFLWACVRRSKLLPEGGALQTVNLAPLVSGLRRALKFAQSATLLERTPAAREFWRALYPILAADRPGLLGAITNRAEAQVMRLAVAYALLDQSPTVDVAHLQAALAVWDFCERSATYIFGRSLGDRLADRILDELRLAGGWGLTQTQIRDLFQRNISSERIANALGILQRLGLASPSKTETSGRGRKAVAWKCTNDKMDQITGVIPSYLSFLSLRALASAGPGSIVKSGIERFA
jgi:hypothetical protein